MLTLRLSARPSTSALVMEMEARLSTASSVQMELCLVSHTLSVTGGSMWTAPLLRNFTHLMMNMQQKEKQTLLLELEVLNIMVVKVEELEEDLQVAEEEDPVALKDRLLHLEGLMLLLQEDREDLEQTLDMVLLEVLEEL